MKKTKYKNKKQKQEIKNKILDFIQINKIFLAMYVISTFYFLYENITTISWDLSVYVLNAQHIFSESLYLEVGRPPLASIIIGIFGIITTWKIAEILFVLTTATLFAYAIYKFSKIIKFNTLLMYALSLNVYVIGYGLSVGTELLSLALLIIATTLIIQNKILSGLFLGLTGLTRYTALAIFPLIIFHYNIKKIIKSLIIFGATVATWLIYNYFAYGNMFESVASQYALNVISRADMNMSMNIMHFVHVINILIPFLLLGLIITIIKLAKHIKTIKNKKQIKEFFQKRKTELIIFTILIYTIYAYATTPLKIARYLFFLTMPTIYFSHIGIQKIIEKIKAKNKKISSKKLIKIIAIIIFLINIILLSIIPIYHDKEDTYIRTVQTLQDLNVSQCRVASNVWPFLNYFGVTSEPFPRQESVQDAINNGKIIHLFKSTSDPAYTQDKEFINSLPILHEEQNLYVIGYENCTKTNNTAINNYLDEAYKGVILTYGYEPNINPCFIMFKNYGLIEKTCNLIHGKGFMKDENRELW